MKNPDRTVHATCDCLEVVRYDRSGKWWIEHRDGEREQVTIRWAVSEALDCETVCDGAIFLGLPGGVAFDRMVWASRGEDAR